MQLAQLFWFRSCSESAGVEAIKIDIINNLPLCKVKIDGRDYTFLVDTGAPNVISEDLFEDLIRTCVR